MAIIGITGNIEPAKRRTLYCNKKLQIADDSWVRLIEKFNHTALIIPIHHSLDKIKDLIKVVDGIILSGGIDISPELYNEKLLNKKWKGQIERDVFDLELLKEARLQNKAVLGICRGFQMINVAYGGSLYQDLHSLRENTHIHRDQELYDGLKHELFIEKNSKLFELFQKEKIYVNSVHHQGIKKLGENLEAMAHSDDGIIEAIRDPQHKFIWGIQWHIEWMQDTEQAKIAEEFFKNV